MMEGLLDKAENLVKENLKEDVTGHDHFHAKRVMNLALKIAEKEKLDVDINLLKLCSLLHDLVDHKVGIMNKEYLKTWLLENGATEEFSEKVLKIIEEIPFKGLKNTEKPTSNEAKIVQDADRLDALGAIGIARCFSTGAVFGNAIYNPEIEPKIHESFEEYKKAKTTSINHFYEKLLHLKDLMNTRTGREIAEERHKFMEEFLKRFFKEWENSN